MKYLLSILCLFIFSCDSGVDGDNSMYFYIKSVNIVNTGISSTSNIYIEFSNPLDIEEFNLLNETYTDADGEVIEQDFTSALKYFEQGFSYITINDITHNFWYDDANNTIAIINSTTSEDCNDGICYDECGEDGILIDNDNILFISSQLKDENGILLMEDMEYTIIKDSQTNICIVPNPTNLNSLLNSENGNVEFFMKGVPEQYVIDIYDLNDNLISSQDNNHNDAELSTYARWNGKPLNSEIQLSYGFYKFILSHNDNLLMQSIIVISH